MTAINTCEALLQAQKDLISLRHMLGLLQAWEDDTELTSVVRETRGALALLQETLEDAKATDAGRRLLAKAMNADNQNEAPDPDELFTLRELYDTEPRDSLALQRDLRVIWQAWDTSTTPQQLGELAGHAGLATSCGHHAIGVLQRYFNELHAEA